MRTVWHEAFDALTPDACYWIGYLFADGSVAADRQVRVSVCTPDRAHLEAFRLFIRSDHKISSLAPKTTHIAGRAVRNRGTEYFGFTSPHMRDRLIALGIRGPALDDQLLRSRDFWRGVWDGDGSLAIYDTPRITLVGHKWLLDAFAVYVLCLTDRTVGVREHKTIHHVKIASHRARRIVADLYRPGDVAMARKANTARLILAHEFARSGYR